MTPEMKAARLQMLKNSHAKYKAEQAEQRYLDSAQHAGHNGRMFAEPNISVNVNVPDHAGLH